MSTRSRSMALFFVAAVNLLVQHAVAAYWERHGDPGTAGFLGTLTTSQAGLLAFCCALTDYPRFAGPVAFGIYLAGDCMLAAAGGQGINGLTHAASPFAAALLVFVMPLRCSTRLRLVGAEPPVLGERQFSLSALAELLTLLSVASAGLAFVLHSVSLRTWDARVFFQLLLAPLVVTWILAELILPRVSGCPPPSVARGVTLVAAFPACWLAYWYLDVRTFGLAIVLQLTPDYLSFFAMISAVLVSNLLLLRWFGVRRIVTRVVPPNSRADELAAANAAGGRSEVR